MNMTEHRGKAEIKTLNQRVLGSSPSASTIPLRVVCLALERLIAVVFRAHFAHRARADVACDGYRAAQAPFVPF